MLCTAAVSYTHLDVYKRQVEVIFRSLKERFNYNGSVSNLRHIIHQIGFRRKLSKVVENF